jgi:hypothetical protein
MSDCITYILFYILVRCVLARTVQSVRGVIKIKTHILNGILLLILCSVFLILNPIHPNSYSCRIQYSRVNLLQEKAGTNMGTFHVVMLSALSNRYSHVLY